MDAARQTIRATAEQPMDTDVTVIIPTCDRGDRLRDAVASLARQTRAPDAVIVVDNGVQANPWIPADAHIRILRTAPRIGPGRARNLGAAQAETALIAFLDDDDYWHPDYLDQALARFRADRSVDVVVACLHRRRLDGVEREYKLFPASAEQQRAVYIRNPGFGGQNIVIKRELFQALGGFDEQLPSSEDRDLAARLLQANANIAVAPAAVAVLCDHAGARASHHEVRGKAQFIIKHWRHMRWRERAAAWRTVVARWRRLRRA